MCVFTLFVLPKAELTDHERFAKKDVPKDEPRHCATWMGVVLIPGNKIHRRLDIKIYAEVMFCLFFAASFDYPYTVILQRSMGFALLYFTGSAEFGKAIRNAAHNLRPKLSLSDAGLYPVNKAKIAGGVEIGPSFKCDSEEAVFAALGMVYKPPYARISKESIEYVGPECGHNKPSPKWKEYAASLSPTASARVAQYWAEHV